MFLHDCQGCESTVERIFTDSWSGKELCVECLEQILPNLLLSPASDRDNMEELVKQL